MGQPIQTERAAAPSGPYCQAIICQERTVCISGQGPILPVSGKFVGDTFEEQAVRTFENLKAVAEAAGASFRHLVRVNVHLTNMGGFAKLNEVYRRYLTERFPARTTVHSALVGLGIVVDGIAGLPR